MIRLGAILILFCCGIANVAGAQNRANVKEKGLYKAVGTVMELKYSAINIPKVDRSSESDGMVRTFLIENYGTEYQREPIYIGKTECKKDRKDATWSDSVQFQFKFDRSYHIRAEMSDCESTKSFPFVGKSRSHATRRVLGETIFSFAELLHADGMKLTQHMKRGGVNVYYDPPNNKMPSKLTITNYEVVDPESTALLINLSITQWGRFQDTWNGVLRGYNIEIIDKNVKPPYLVYETLPENKRGDSPFLRWKQFTLPIMKFYKQTGGKISKGGIDNSFRHVSIVLNIVKKVGYEQVNYPIAEYTGDLLTDVLGFTDRLTDRFEMTDMKGKSKNGFELRANVKQETFTFARMVNDGMKTSTVVAIDFTSSNVVSKLHQPNTDLNGATPYEYAIRAVLEVMKDYDDDGNFPVRAFGISPKRTHQTDGSSTLHCYTVLDPDRTHLRECPGITNVVKAYVHLNGKCRPYSRNLHQRYLKDDNYEFYYSGPTYYRTCILDTINMVEEARRKDPANVHYYVLLLITDGECCDLEETKKAIVKASVLPMSIVIVGVGNSNFRNMIALDSDEKLLRDRNDNVAKRDIVQFVNFNEAFERNDVKKLAGAVLEELPGQIKEYFIKNEISISENLPETKLVFQNGKFIDVSKNPSKMSKYFCCLNAQKSFDGKDDPVQLPKIHGPPSMKTVPSVKGGPPSSKGKNIFDDTNSSKTQMNTRGSPSGRSWSPPSRTLPNQGTTSVKSPSCSPSTFNSMQLPPQQSTRSAKGSAPSSTGLRPSFNANPSPKNGGPPPSSQR